MLLICLNISHCSVYVRESCSSYGTYALCCKTSYKCWWKNLVWSTDTHTTEHAGQWCLPNIAGLGMTHVQSIHVHARCWRFLRAWQQELCRHSKTFRNSCMASKYVPAVMTQEVDAIQGPKAGEQMLHGDQQGEDNGPCQVLALCYQSH